MCVRDLLLTFVLVACTPARVLTSEKVVAFTRALSAAYDEISVAGLGGRIDANEMMNRQSNALSRLKSEIGLDTEDVNAIDASAHVVWDPSPAKIDDTRTQALNASKPALAEYAEHQRHFYSALSTTAAARP